MAFGSYSQNITRGPEIGEIYFIGPGVASYGLYYSTSFGETAVYVDSTIDLWSISADKTAGGIYYASSTDDLFYSPNYGVDESWIYKNSGIYSILCSGINDGYIFEGCSSHSEDYGSNFINHSGNGLYGGVLWADISYNGKGYTITHIHPTDSLCFYLSNDNFNNNQLTHIFSYDGYGFYFVTSAADSNGVYYYNGEYNELWYSDDDGYNWELKNQLTCPNLPIVGLGITGGRQDGEIYIKVQYGQFMGYIRHVFIYHSLDYGETFTVYHPVAIGDDPVYAYFEANETSGQAPFEVQFLDMSSGGLANWEWDFNNDGITDSYEQNPTYTYQDTGYYTVELKGSYFVITDSAIRYDYIHVVDFTNTSEQESNNELNFYPNPFTNQITFEFPTDKNNSKIYIYNIAGQLINTLQKPQDVKKLVWDGKDTNGNKCLAGIYYIRSENNTFSKKILLIK